MKTNLYEILNGAGTTVACYEGIEDINNLTRLHPGYLMDIAPNGLLIHGQPFIDGNQPEEPNRYLVAKDEQEKNLLSMVQPMRCYLRDHDMNAQVIEFNPFQSVRWLISWIRKERNIPQYQEIRLTVNETELKNSNDSLGRYLHEEAIIHLQRFSNNNQDIIKELLFKEPGQNSELKRLNEVNRDEKIHIICQKISEITGIPLGQLYLVYGGKILSRSATLREHAIQNEGTVIYAVDGRRYMKKISILDYKKRLQEVRRVRPNNQIIRKNMKDQKLRSKLKKKESLVADIDMDIKKIEQKDKSQQNYQYFDQQMNIQGDEIEEFRKKKLVEEEEQFKTNHKHHHGPIEAPENTPRALTSNDKAQSNNDDKSQLREGRIKTQENDMYEDISGHVHEHHKEKYIYKDGHTKVVETEVIEDNDGNILQKETDTIEHHLIDKVSGHTHEHQRDVVEEGNSKKVIQQDIDIDENGNVTKVENDMYQDEEREDGTKVRHSHQVTQEENKQTIVDTEVVEDASGNPVRIQTDVNERQVDPLTGQIHEHTKQIIEENQKTTVIDRDTITAADGHVVRQQTDIVEINQDQQGNTYRHEHQEITEQNKVTVVDKDLVQDSQGRVISRETDIKVIESGSNNSSGNDGSTHKHEIDIIEAEGKTTVIEKDIVEDAEHQVTHRETKVTQITKLQNGDYEIVEDRDVEDVVDNQDGEVVEYTEEIEKDIEEDESGKVHEHQRRVIQTQDGKIHIQEYDTIKDENGNVVRAETDVIDIQEDEKGNIHRHQTDICEEADGFHGKKSYFYENEQNIAHGQNGQPAKITQNHTDMIQKEEDNEGHVHRHQTQITEIGGKRTIIERDEVGDTEGHVFESSVNVIENGTEVQMQKVEAEQEPIKQQNPIQTKIEVDEDGNTHIHHKVVNQDQNGEVHILNTEQVEDKDGNLIQTETNVVDTELLGNGVVYRHQTEITEKADGSKKVEIDREENRDQHGVISAHTQIIEIQVEQGKDGSKVHRHEMEIDEAYGDKVIKQRNIDIDEQGNITYEEKQPEVKLQDQQPQQKQEEKEGEKVEVDQEGNVHIHHKVVQQDENGEVHITQTQEVDDRDGNIVRLEANVVETDLLDNGVVYRHQTEVTSTANGARQVQIERYEDIDEHGVINASTKITQIEKQQTEEGEKVHIHQMQIDEDRGDKMIQERNVDIDEKGEVTVQEGTPEIRHNNTEQQQEEQPINNEVDVQEKEKNENQQKVIDESTKFNVDEEGNVHTFHKVVTEDSKGTVRIQNTEQVVDKDGNFIKIEGNIVETELEPDGTIHRNQTEVMENVDGRRVEIDREEQRDEHGVIEAHTDIIEIQKQKAEGGQKTHIHEIQIDQKGKDSIIQERDINIDEKGQVNVQEKEPQIKHTETQQEQQEQPQQQGRVETKVQVDEDGNTHTHTKVVNEDEEGHVHIVETDEVSDKDGNLIKKQTDRVDTELLENGVIHRHERETNQMADGSRIVEIDRDQNIGEKGVIEAHTTIVEIDVEKVGNSEKIHRHEMEIDESGGDSIIRQTDIKMDENGYVTIEEGQPEGRHTVTDEEINREDYQQPQRNEDENLVKQTSEIEMIEDDEGLIHVQQRKVFQGQNGHTTVVETEVIEDSHGKPVQVETDIVDIEQNADGSIHQHHTHISEEQGKVTVVQEDQQSNSKPNNEQSQQNLQQDNTNTNVMERNEITIETDEQGDIHTHTTKVVEEIRIEKDGDGNEQVKQINTMTINEDTVTHQITNQDGQAIGNQVNIERTTQYTHNTYDGGDLLQSEKKIEQQQSPSNNQIEDKQQDEDSQLISQVIQENITKIAVMNDEGQMETVQKKQTYELDVFQNQDGSVIQHQQKTQEVQDVDGNFQKIQEIKNTLFDQQGNLRQTEEQVIKTISGENGELTIQRQVQRETVVELQDAQAEIQNVKKESEGSKVIVETMEYQTNNMSSGQNLQEGLQKKPMMITVKSIASEQSQEQDIEGNTIKVHEHIQKMTEQQVSADINNVNKTMGTPIMGDEDIGEIKQSHHTMIEQIVNKDGETIKKETNEITQQYVKTENGQQTEIHRHQTDTIEQDGQKSVTQRDQVVVQDNTQVQQQQNDQEIMAAYTNTVEVQQDEEGNIHRHEVEIVEADGEVTVKETDIFQSKEDDLLADGEDNQEGNGQEEKEEENLLESYKEVYTDQNGLTHTHEKQIIQINDGQGHIKEQICETDVVKNSQGQVISSQVHDTQIELCDNDTNVKETHIDILDNPNGQTIIETNIIRDEEGNVISEEVITTVTANPVVVDQQLIDQVDLLESGQNVQQGKQKKEELVDSTELMDLLGISKNPAEEQEQQRQSIVPKVTESVFNSDQILMAQAKLNQNESEDLLKQSSNDDNAVISSFTEKKQLLESQQTNKMVEPRSAEGSVEEIEEIPKVFQVIVKHHLGSETSVEVGFDWNVEELAQKYAQIEKKNRDHLKFYKDGRELAEYDMLAEEEVEPGTVIYVFEQATRD